MFDGNQIEIPCSFRRDNSVSCSKILIFGTPSAPNMYTDIYFLFTKCQNLPRGGNCA